MLMLAYAKVIFTRLNEVCKLVLSNTIWRELLLLLFCFVFFATC